MDHGATLYRNTGPARTGRRLMAAPSCASSASACTYEHMGRNGVATVVALLTIASCASARDATVPAYLGDYDLLAADVSLSPDGLGNAVVGRTRLRMRVLRDGMHELRLDANALAISSATANGASIETHVADDHLVVTLPRSYRRGEQLDLRFAYAGTPARGLVLAENVAFTSYFTCDWMICALDRPGDKATFTLELSLPADWTAFASGTATPPRDTGARRTWRFNQTAAYSAHLFGFSAGRLNEVRVQHGIAELVYASAEASAPDLARMFADTPGMVDFFERAAGVPLPHALYFQAIVQDASPQEGAGFAILPDDAVRPVLENSHEDWAIAHELAHQWWGNSITCATWADLWLNEGVTTFMVAAYKQHRWGEADYQREIELAQRRWAVARSAGWDRPLAYAGSYPDLRTRRAVQYSKGMLFMVALRRELGEEVFWRALRDYSLRFAGGVVTSRDFQRSFERSSHRDLSSLFLQWVY